MQPTQDLLSVQRRPLDVEDYIDIVRRHKSWIIGPAFAALVLSVMVACLWPNTYVSEGTVQVVPPQVPERYVASNVNSELTQRINSMVPDILRRANLQNIINTYGLYRSDLNRKPLDDVLEDMRKAVKISPVATIQSNAGGRVPISAFKVSYEYSNRNLAQRVCQELIRNFIDANMRTLSNQSQITTGFLKDEVAKAKAHLDDLENQLTQFRVRNAGRLPDEMQANLASLRSFETQLAGTNEAISRIGQEKLLLESQIRIYKDQLASMRQAPDQFSASAKSERLAQIERDITNGETELSRLKERYKETHPDVKAAESQLAVLKRRRDALLKEEAQKKPETAQPAAPNPLLDRSAREIEASIARLQSEIQAKDLELEERQKTQKTINDAINNYNARIQAQPIMERNYAELTRDYNLAKQRYEDLNAKKSQSETATALENRQIGEQLQLLDPANLPETPTKPNRLMIIGAGLGIGVMLGIFTAGAREMKDTSLKSLKDARAYTNLPVLGTVPLLENDLVVRRKRRLTWLAWATACILGLVAMTGSVYYYYTTTKM